MKSITQAADELGVSRTKIYGLINKHNITTIRESKNNLIKDEDYEKIKEIVLNEQNNVEDTIKTDDVNETARERLRNVLERDRSVLYTNVSDREYTDLKERINQLEKQIDRKDLQIEEQSEQLTEAMKANNTLIESNKELNKLNTQLNVMAFKALNPPAADESVTVDVNTNKEASWIKRLFKKNK